MATVQFLLPLDMRADGLADLDAPLEHHHLFAAADLPCVQLQTIEERNRVVPPVNAVRKDLEPVSVLVQPVGQIVQIIAAADFPYHGACADLALYLEAQPCGGGFVLIEVNALQIHIAGGGGAALQRYTQRGDLLHQMLVVGIHGIQTIHHMDNRIDAIYGRQSIDKKDSISIESQFEFCRYELKGGEAKEYKDKGYSGKNIERPDFQRLLQDIRLGLIKRVIVYKLDRISRSIVDFAKLMELFKQYDVEFVSCTEKFDTSTPMGRAMLNICIVFAQLERESIQMRVQDAFYSRCTKGYYMRGRTPYGFDTEPIVMDGIKTKKLVENAEMDFAELMFQMYAEPGNSYGDITRYFVKHSIKVYDKALQRGFISKLLRNPVYVQADMDIYEYYKAQGVKIESPPEMFTGDNSCYLYQGREGEEQILVIAPHQGRISSQLWLTVQRKLSQNTSFQNGRKCHNTWLAGKIKCGRCGYALAALRAQNGVTYLRCKQRAENGSCEGAGTLTAQSMEAFVYGEMVKKMQKFHTLKGGKEQSYNPKLTAARVALAKTESEIEKLLDTLSGANPLLLQYANNRIEELDAERQKQLRLVADLTANSVSASQIDSITGYLDDWESVSFDDKRKVVDILISQIDATSEEVVIHWKI